MKRVLPIVLLLIACSANAANVEIRYAKYKPHGAYIRLSNDNFILDADDKSGVIKGLYLKNDTQGTNFMGSIKHDVEYKGRDSLTLSIRRKTE